MELRTPYKSRDTKTYRGESREKLKDIGTGGKFLNRREMACAVRKKKKESTNGTSENFKASVRQKILSIRQKGYQQIGKGF